MKIQEILKVTGGKLLMGNRAADIDLSKVSTDSRLIKRGELFIALSGPNFRGSDFIGDAFKKGAIGAISEEPMKTLSGYSGKILVTVKDAVKALQAIAARHRAKFRIPVIGITGSNGKTTVKEMIASVLSGKYRVLKNEGTKNNHIGVPQTLLKLTKDHQVCVLELGTNHKGEIGALSDIAKPTAAVITNIGPSHLEHFIDLKGVCKEKARIMDCLGKGALVVVNGDDTMLAKIKSGRFKLLKYGLGGSNDFTASDISAKMGRIGFKINGAMKCSLKLLGEHNVYNALAAIAVGSQFKVSVGMAARALANFKPASMRLSPSIVNGISIVNDSYNSNPASMKAALEAISAYPVKARWVVSGDMLELGREEVSIHRMIGELIAGSNAAGLLTYGGLSRHTLSGALASGMSRGSLWHCFSHDEIADILKRVTRKGDMVLIKGSRGMKMEKVIDRLKA